MYVTEFMQVIMRLVGKSILLSNHQRRQSCFQACIEVLFIYPFMLEIVLLNWERIALLLWQRNSFLLRWKLEKEEEEGPNWKLSVESSF